MSLDAQYYCICIVHWIRNTQYRSKNESTKLIHNCVLRTNGSSLGLMTLLAQLSFFDQILCIHGYPHKLIQVYWNRNKQIIIKSEQKCIDTFVCMILCTRSMIQTHRANESWAPKINQKLWNSTWVQQSTHQNKKKYDWFITITN